MSKTTSITSFEITVLRNNNMEDSMCTCSTRRGVPSAQSTWGAAPHGEDRPAQRGRDPRGEASRARAEGTRRRPGEPEGGWETRLGDARGSSRSRRSCPTADGSAGGNAGGRPWTGASQHAGSPGPPPPPERATSFHPQERTTWNPKARHEDLFAGAEAC